MSHLNRSLSLTAILMMGSAAFAAETGPSTTQPTAGTYESYQAAAKAASQDYLKLIPKTEELADANAVQRDALAAQAIPLVKQVLVNLDGMTSEKPQNKLPILAVRLNQEAFLYALNDADTLKSLDDRIKAGGEEGDLAMNVQLRGRWYRAGKDAAKQAEVIQAIDQAATAKPADLMLTQFIADSRSAAKDPAIRQHLADLMANTMNNRASKGLRAQMTADDKKLSFEGKPLVLAGKQPDGTDFTTADWTGKVILVDFWAVWCAPCVAELPRVKKVYDQYHAQGFEVLGVSNDEQLETLKNFTAKKGLPWPQLFDADAAEKGAWNPLTKSFGINGIPTMFLIDKKGVCRTVSAREDFETLIPKLLAE